LFALASWQDAAPASLSRSLCNAQQQDANDKTPQQPPSVQANATENGITTFLPPPGSSSAAAVDEAARSVAAAAATESSAAASAAVAAALDAANAVPSPEPASDAATSVAAAAEVIYSSGVSRPPSPLDVAADTVAHIQQHAQVLVGDQEQVKASSCRLSFLFIDMLQVKPAAIIPPVVGSPDNYKQMYENTVVELNKRGDASFHCT
jgi:hypothetical protein